MGAASRARSESALRDTGTVTVEAAIALCGFVAVLAMVLAGLSAVLDEIRCTDAAREAARLVARGEPDRAQQIARQIAPGATVAVDTDGDSATVVVSAAPVGVVLPGLRVSAKAYAVLEPAAADQDATDPPNAAPAAVAPASVGDG